MKLSFLLSAAIAAVTASSQQQHVSEILSALEPHKSRSMFAELSAGVTVAHTMQDQLAQSGRSPIAEVAAMADMMNIQLVEEVAQLAISHTKYQNNCKKKVKEYSKTIAEEHNTEKVEWGDAEDNRLEWVSLLPKLPELDAAMRKKDNQIKASEDAIAAAGQKRAAQHKAYLKAVAEHDKALDDVRNIRLIVQKSALDNRAKQSKTNSAGAKSAAAATVKKLVEMKSEVHPRLANLVELSSRAFSEQTTTGAVDLIYKLIYQTRDQLVKSKNKLIKSEQAANSNWRTNKLAFRADINDLHILKMTYYMEKGIKKKEIGNLKKQEGAHKQEMSAAVKEKEDTQIDKNFLITACDEEQNIYNGELSRLQSELATIKAVQDKLKTLKWSTKVFKSVASVTEKVTYFEGNTTYNIRSAFGRYMIKDSKGNAVFKPAGKQSMATNLGIVIDKKTLKYQIQYIDYSDKSKQGKKAPRWNLVEKNSKVFFSRGSYSDKSDMWEFDFDAGKSLAYFIKNVRTRNTLYLETAKNAFTLTTGRQSEDKHAQFTVERSNFVAVGCYKDKINANLQYYAGASNSQGPYQCYKECQKAVADKKVKSYTHFGLSNGNQCYCGTSWNQEIAPINDCDRLNLNGEIVGGNMRSYIYKITPDGKSVYAASAPSKVVAKKGK